MPGRNRTLLLLGLAAALIVACCCGLTLLGFTLGALNSIGLGGREVNDSLSLSAPAEVPLALAINNPVGRVTIVASGGDEVRVEAVRGANTRDVLEQITVSLDGSPRNRAISVTGPRRSNWSVDLVIEVPSETSVSLEAGVGEVEIVGLAGRFNLNVGVGAIHATGLAVREGSEFRSGTGEITIDADLAEEVTLRAISGVGDIAVTLPAATGFALEAETGTGTVTWEGFELEASRGRSGPVGDQVRATTSTAPAGRRLVLTSGVGDVALTAR